jgi:hypothetical protein
VSHANLERVEDPTRELVESRSTLQALTGQQVELFSFPYGAHHRQLVERCREAGYRRVFTTQPVPVRYGDDPFVIGRVPVGPDDWWWEFRLKLCGAYRWMPAASAVKRRLRRS